MSANWTFIGFILTKNATQLKPMARAMVMPMIAIGGNLPMLVILRQPGLARQVVKLRNWR